MLSVIVPAYNSEKFIERCVKSILTQSLHHFELIIVDDGSQDGTGAICDAFAREDDRVRVLHSPHVGVAAVRNIGFQAASGEYVVQVDADDYIAPDMLQKINSVICAWRPDIIVFDAFIVTNERTTLQKNHIPPGFHDREFVQLILPVCLCDKHRLNFTCLISHINTVKAIKRNILWTCRCRDESFTRAEDVACFYECLYHAQSIYYLDKPLYYHSGTNPRSITSMYDPNFLEGYKKCRDYWKAGTNYGRAYPEQADAFYACGMLSMMLHEARHRRKWSQSLTHVKEVFGKLEESDYAVIRHMPFYARAYLLLLKHGWYAHALFLAKLYVVLAEGLGPHKGERHV